MMQQGADYHFEIGARIAIEGLKGLLIVNGGGATALIALTERGMAADKFVVSILFFGAGAIVAVAATLTAYFSQLYYANSLIGTNSKKGDGNQYSLHVRLQFITIALAIASLGFGVCALVEAFCATKVAHQ